jgi:UDP-N-acetylmuramoyl-L-alanyl-D-glutamate--2,6-diaminopimelate ligase
VKIGQLFEKAGLCWRAGSDAEVSGLAYNSKLVKPGNLFFAVKGVHADGHQFLPQVAAQGAVAAVVERSNPALPCFVTPDVLGTMSKLANAYFDRPSQRIPVIGITGTNGKTTTSYLIEAILKSAGQLCGVMGTVNYRIGADERPAPNTTPMSLDVQAFIDEAKRRGAAAVAIEVSSHALELKRVDDVRFAVGVFSNLTQDHLDFHGTMERYFQAKRKLFVRADPPKAAINIDDDFGRRLSEEIPSSVTYGLFEEAKLRAVNVKCDLKGLRFDLKFPSGKVVPVANNLLGLHNVSNCLAAAAGLFQYGLSEEKIAAGLNQKLGVPGRLERVEAGQNFVITVDYAHTHDALAQALTTLRNTGPKRLICVFGAGGDRDKTKRPRMGDVAIRLADYVIVTSDNPRSEDPKTIMREIEQGILPTGKTAYELIEDRKAAIVKALGMARKGDVVLIAGKGHETYQIIGTQKHHFSDQEVAAEAVRGA